MISYVTYGTNDFAAAERFYTAALAPLGIVKMRDDKDDAGYGLPSEGEPAFYIGTPYDEQPANRGNGTMLCLTAPSRAAVDQFYAAALSHGGTDEGAPGLRPYGAHFYACYVRDPDGNKLSAVCSSAE